MKYIVVALSVIIALISLLLLISTVVLVIHSGKKLFSQGIYVLHFNNIISLYIALFSVAFISLPMYLPESCIPVSFFLHFLWTNVFLSSLSMAIGIFLSSLKIHTLLILIGWLASILWAVAATIIRMFLYGALSKDNCPVIDLFFVGPMVVILLINSALLVVSYVNKCLMRNKPSGQDEKVDLLQKAILTSIVFVKSMGLRFFSSQASGLNATTQQLNNLEMNFLFLIITIIISSPIGVLHFLTIINQIRGANRRRPIREKKKTSIENSTEQQAPYDTISDSGSLNHCCMFQ